MEDAANPFPGILRVTQAFFDRSTACLEEEDSEFAPAPGMFTVAQQVAHVAQTFDWFIEGAFRPEGFDLDFAALDGKVRAVTSLEEARKWFAGSVERAISVFESKSVEELTQPLPEGPIMGGEPRTAIVAAMADHTSHHRGALTVYARLRGKTPAMPYG
jgi:uncharacterized damage-inducible protein DinB